MEDPRVCPDVHGPDGGPLRVMFVMGGVIRSGVDSVILTLAGSLCSAGLKDTVALMIENNMVDAVVSTGANIVDQDFFEEELLGKAIKKSLPKTKETKDGLVVCVRDGQGRRRCDVQLAGDLRIGVQEERQRIGVFFEVERAALGVSHPLADRLGQGVGRHRWLAPGRLAGDDGIHHRRKRCVGQGREIQGLCGRVIFLHAGDQVAGLDGVQVEIVQQTHIRIEAVPAEAGNLRYN